MIRLSNWFLDPVVLEDEAFVQIRDHVLEILVADAPDVAPANSPRQFAQADDIHQLVQADGCRLVPTARGLQVLSLGGPTVFNVISYALVAWSCPGAYMVVDVDGAALVMRLVWNGFIECRQLPVQSLDSASRQYLDEFYSSAVAALDADPPPF